MNIISRYYRVLIMLSLQDESDENYGQDLQDKEKSITDVSSISSYSQSIIDYINQKGWKYLSASDLSDLDSIESLQFQDENAHSDGIKAGTTNALKENQNYEIYENEFEDKVDKKNSFSIEDDEETHVSQNNLSHKSKLFQKCLTDLGQELKVYKQENEMLRMKQQKVKEEYKKVKDLYAHLKDEKDILQLEKEQLAQEKSSFKSKLKEAYQKVYEKLVEKNQEDHQKISVVKNELEKLKDTYLQKESEWSVINGRQKSQIRVLQIENSKLKQELKEYQENNVKCKKLNSVSNAKGIQPSNTVHNGKNLVKNKMNVQQTKVDMNCGTSLETDQEKLYKEEFKRKNHLITAESIVRKRNLYESLLRDAVKDFPNNQVEKKVNEDHLKNKNDQQNEVKEIQHPDGRIEYHHPNGNVKIVFPNECRTKMIYYNGDIQESDNDGTIKYFYASSKTLHITMPDGLEIFEFPE